jgi:hypothetical protein
MSTLTRSRIALIAVASAGLCTAAMGQSTSVVPVNPYWAVVAEEETLLRSGAGDMMYPIARLPRAQILRVDGEATDPKGKNWARIAYPQNTFVFIPADALQAEPSGKTGTLVKGVQPKAPNMVTGITGSWASAASTALTPGAKLTIVGTEQNAEGKVTAYRVAPPETSRAFVATATIRRATPEEIAAAAGATATPGTTTASATNPAASPTPPAATPEQRPATTDLTQPMQTGSGQAGAAPTESASAAPEVAPVQIAQTPVQPQPSPYERLESALEALRQQPIEQAEVSELMSEFQAEIARLDNSPTNRSLKARLNQRVEYLKILVDLQKQQRALAESEQHLTLEDKRLAQRLAEVDRTRQYTIVGRLSASTIYDGKRLPLMYRVQTVGGPAPRTLAYIKPDEKLAIDGKLGQLVGVVGDAQMDSTLKLNIITPLRVDTLEATEQSTTLQTKVDEDGQ